MLLGHYVVVLLCYCNIMLLGYYVVMLLCYCNVMSRQSSFHIRADYQYITTFIKQRIQLYYNNLHTII